MPESPRLCFRCGTEFPPGGLAYRMNVSLSADFDGYIDGDNCAPGAADALLDAAAGLSAEQLHEQIHRTRTLLFCHICAEQVWQSVARPRVRGLS